MAAESPAGPARRQLWFSSLMQVKMSTATDDTHVNSVNLAVLLWNLCVNLG